MKDNLIATPKEYNLYIEWGTATTTLKYHQISNKLKEYLAQYYCPHGGVSMGIFPNIMLTPEDKRMEIHTYRYDLLEKHNQFLKDELFSCLGLNANADFDDFAKKFGGLKRKDIVRKIRMR